MTYPHVVQVLEYSHFLECHDVSTRGAGFGVFILLLVVNLLPELVLVCGVFP